MSSMCDHHVSGCQLLCSPTFVSAHRDVFLDQSLVDVQVVQHVAGIVKKNELQVRHLLVGEPRHPQKTEADDQGWDEGPLPYGPPRRGGVRFRVGRHVGDELAHFVLVPGGRRGRADSRLCGLKEAASAKPLL